ncbi:hypothetical protein Patl1_10428 [Pistacia atlantica]|uniref:Uncharacterized protein n=1 Tax=Pistacia atlantica TaxID=434234 RepID=A0ACC1A857_9ROSI|nr:hypothetical protein Patl1_10428 [Pistacia atlantica]
MEDYQVNPKSESVEIGAPESSQPNPPSPPADDKGLEDCRDHSKSLPIVGFESKITVESRDNDAELPRPVNKDEQNMESKATQKNMGKYFYYDSPHYEDTGVWIPVSVPPMMEGDNEEWARELHTNGVEMLLVARGKVSAIAKGDIHGVNFSWISNHLLEQAWQEMAQTLTEANFGNVSELLEAEPPKWMADSAASACMLCGVRFHPIMCSRHHCRFCGGIFCGECSKGRSLLPAKFRVSDPQRVCDVCCVRLDSVQPYLMNQSMEYEIYKATNTIRGYSKMSFYDKQKGLAVLSIAKVGMMVTYNIGTGLVVARREDGSWSPPSAISSFGVGWGAQAGGELTDFIIVLRTNEAVKTFTGNVHLSIGAGLSAAVGTVGRAAEADVRAGDGGYAACYTYSCSKGAFVGCSLEGSIFTTRTRENSRFYGSQSITASDILLGSMPMPPAAAILYPALEDLYQKFQR